MSDQSASSGRELGAKQQLALSALRAGMNFATSAEQAGVDRVTLYRWIQKDPHFKAAYNLWQQEVVEAARGRLLRLSEKAVDVMERKMDEGSEKAAVAVLRHVGVMRRRRRQSTDAEVLALQIQLEEKREHDQASKAMIEHLLAKAGVRPAKRRRIIDGTSSLPFMENLDQVLNASQEDEAEGDATSSDDSEQSTPAACVPSSDDNLHPEHDLDAGKAPIPTARQRATLRAAVASHVAHPAATIHNANISQI